MEESAQKVNFGKENSPAAPVGTRTRNLSITNPALLPRSHHGSMLLLRPLLPPLLKPKRLIDWPLKTDHSSLHVALPMLLLLPPPLLLLNKWAQPPVRSLSGMLKFKPKVSAMTSPRPWPAVDDP